MPRAFISYSWDNDDHRNWVRKLAEDLRSAGIDVRLDVWDAIPGESVSKFMETEVLSADYIITICTPRFAAKSEARSGGAGYEQQIVSGVLLSGTPRSRFIPVLRQGDVEGASRAIPATFLGTFFLDFREDESYQNSLEDLIRAVFESPRHIRPSLGEPPKYILPGRDEKPLLVTIKLVLDSRYRISAADAELAIREFLGLKRRGRQPQFEVDCAEYSLAKTELATPAKLSSERRLELMRLVESHGIRTRDRDEALSEVAQLFGDVICAQRGLAGQQERAGRILSNVINIFALDYAGTNGCKFDISHESLGEGFGIYLSETEVQELEKSERTEVGRMTHDWGLRIEHMTEKVFDTQIVPGMLRDYLWSRYQAGRQHEPKELLDLSRWTAGLG